MGSGRPGRWRGYTRGGAVARGAVGEGDYDTPLRPRRLVMRPSALPVSLYYKLFNYTIDSIRRSGINQIIATITYSASAIQGCTKASRIASAYIDSDNLPFKSVPT